MSEISAILTPEDKLDLASWMIETLEAQFVVDDNQPSISILSTLESVKPVLLSAYPQLIFIVSVRWTSLPLYKRSMQIDGRGEVHYIQQRFGGPAFTWLPGNVLRDQTPPALSAGFISDYPDYYVRPGSIDSMRRPDSMVSAFAQISAWIRRAASGHRTLWPSTSKAGPWISKSALSAVESGSSQLANKELDAPTHVA
jgi:hypothetical protein